MKEPFRLFVPGLSTKTGTKSESLLVREDTGVRDEKPKTHRLFEEVIFFQKTER